MAQRSHRFVHLPINADVSLNPHACFISRLPRAPADPSTAVEKSSSRVGLALMRTLHEQEHPSYGNWAGGIVKQYSRLGMASSFSSSGITGLNSLGF